MFGPLKNNGSRKLVKKHPRIPSYGYLDRRITKQRKRKRKTQQFGRIVSIKWRNEKQRIFVEIFIWTEHKLTT
jgi:hypothetical protein